MTPGRVYKNAVTTSTCLEGYPKKDVLCLTQNTELLRTAQFQSYNSKQMVAGSISPIDNAAR